MRTLKPKITLAMLIILIVSLTGCQFMQSVADIVGPSVDTPRKRWAAAEMAYQTTGQTLDDLVEAGQFDLEELLKIKKYNRLARRSLDAWDEALTNGTDPAQHRRTFDRAISILKDLVEVATDADQSAAGDLYHLPARQAHEKHPGTPGWIEPGGNRGHPCGITTNG